MIRFKSSIGNIGLCFSLLLNFLCSLLLLHIVTADFRICLVITLLLFLGSMALLLTPITDWWYRKIILGLREPDQWEAEQLLPIYEEVYCKAREVEPHLSPAIELFIFEDEAPNAFAIGKSTIAVHSGLLSYHLSTEEIAGILAHEFAHIAHGDTVCTLLAIQSNSILTALRGILSWLISLLANILACSVSIAFDTTVSAKIAFRLVKDFVKALGWLIDHSIGFILFLSASIAICSRRQQELEADQFAALLGYGPPLIRFFRRTSGNAHVHSVFNWSYLFHGTHPSASVRISNLQKQTAQSKPSPVS